MKKHGFTLLELVVVIIILGILGTLGTQQYFRMIERSRGAEARTIIGQIRSMAAGHLMAHYNLDDFEDDQAGIGSGEDQIPSVCRSTYYFKYNITSSEGKNLTITAFRCEGAAGKSPGVATASNYNLTLKTDFSKTGSDEWKSNPKGMY
ncbi:MAG: prepilin-type N-terminal cleavage/methylation domain-containing protein [Candidatus Omnitrophota bacterium]|nr:MAG: prepilin-type N-terminal cleavage/methylation domain-containing protein [Candidatus Omnitrophota bacterium]